MRNRLERGRLNKAQRGEMLHSVPMGSVLMAKGRVACDPDQQAHDVVHVLFEKCAAISALYGLFHYLVRHDIRLPIRARSGPNKGQ
jgi:hypothetical protein